MYSTLMLREKQLTNTTPITGYKEHFMFIWDSMALMNFSTGNITLDNVAKVR
jgi:hypothetical protein